MRKHRSNTIYGLPLEFGKPEQIAWIKHNCEVMAGEAPVCEIDWQFVSYTGGTNDSGAPRTYYRSPRTADALMAYVECPRCGRVHKHIVGYDPTSVDQTAELYRAESEIIDCYNCGLEMQIENGGSRNVYVLQETNEEFPTSVSAD